MALLWRNDIFKEWLDGHRYVLAGLTGIFLLGMAALVVWSPSSDSLWMQSIGYSWIAVFYGMVLASALAQPTWPIAVVARSHWLAEIGRVSYCLYLIHDAVRVGGSFLLKTLRPDSPSWEFVAVNAVAAVISFLIARLSTGVTSNIRCFAVATNSSTGASAANRVALTWAKAGTSDLLIRPMATKHPEQRAARENATNQHAITLAVTGASGAIYARAVLRLLEADPRVGHVYLVASDAGLRLLASELGVVAADGKKLPSLLKGSATKKTEYLPNKYIGASIASGSARLWTRWRWFRARGRGDGRNRKRHRKRPADSRCGRLPEGAPASGSLPPRNASQPHSSREHAARSRRRGHGDAGDARVLLRAREY